MSDATTIRLGDTGYEDALMDIVGTAFKVGEGKFLTCWHVCQGLRVREGCAYLQTTEEKNGVWVKRYWPVGSQLNFVDPRIKAGNPEIDVGLIISPMAHEKYQSIEPPSVKWGNSSKLGIGDRVLIGGFPLGRDMFLALQTNRGIVQPSFFEGIISAIIPATNERETRLLQISSVALGGISGGIVCDPLNGKVLGMVTSGLTNGADVSLPITYAIPSEVLRPWCDAISYKASDGSLRK